METGVDEAFADICRAAAIDWPSLRAEMRATEAVGIRDSHKTYYGTWPHGFDPVIVTVPVLMASPAPR